MSIQTTFISWYLQNKRDLPWRNIDDAYHIWISEIILQQTRVAQGLAYYNRFIELFPTVQSLANADSDAVLKAWQGLGYYSRARNLHEGAKYVVKQFNGEIPAEYNLLRTIKGVGEYTASAIASLAFNLPHPVVDGNVNRVISRIFGVLEPIDSTAGIKRIKEIAAEIIDKEQPGLHNQAIMEFGALQCIPRNPQCNACPFVHLCFAFKNNMVGELPVKLPKKPVARRNFYYLFIQFNNKVFLGKREKKDIWQGLYELPLIETPSVMTLKELAASESWKQIFEKNHVTFNSDPVELTHQLSHQTIIARFLNISISSPSTYLNNNYINIDAGKIHQYPVSKLIDNYFTIAGI